MRFSFWREGCQIMCGHILIKHFFFKGLQTVNPLYSRVGMGWAGTLFPEFMPIYLVGPVHADD